jgi:hypothetical protein
MLGVDKLGVDIKVKNKENTKSATIREGKILTKIN